MTAYQDAYKVLEQYLITTPISELTFKELQINFRENYLASKQFSQLMITHRSPNSVTEELLYELNSYLIAIQNRIEMRDTDPNTKLSGYLPTMIGEIWLSNKPLKSLYISVQTYCRLRQKNFTTIAIHLAEYRSLYKLFSRLKNQ